MSEPTQIDANGIQVITADRNSSISIGPTGVVLKSGFVTAPLYTGQIGYNGFSTNNPNGIQFSSPINLNSNNLLNASEITASADLSLNPTNSIVCNGKTLKMGGGEIHNVPLVHGQNNQNITIQAQGTGSAIIQSNSTNPIVVNSSGVTDYQNNNITGVNSITATTFNGSITDATNAANVYCTSDNTSGTYYIPFVKMGSSGNKPLFIDDTSGPLTYNASVGILGCNRVNSPLLYNTDTGGNNALYNTAQTGSLSIFPTDATSCSTTLTIAGGSAHTGSINIGAGASTKNITIGSAAGGTTLIRGGIVTMTSSTSANNSFFTANTGGSLSILPIDGTVSSTNLNIATGSNYTGGINIGTGASVKPITIGNVAGGTLQLAGSAVNTNIFNCSGNLTGTNFLAPSGSSTVPICGNLTTGSIEIGNTGGTGNSHTTQIATGNGNTGAINIGTGSGTKSLNIGGSTTTTTINGIIVPNQATYPTTINTALGYTLENLTTFTGSGSGGLVTSATWTTLGDNVVIPGKGTWMFQGAASYRTPSGGAAIELVQLCLNGGAGNFNPVKTAFALSERNQTFSTANDPCEAFNVSCVMNVTALTTCYFQIYIQYASGSVFMSTTPGTWTLTRIG
jgi:hypothetical protein